MVGTRGSNAQSATTTTKTSTAGDKSSKRATEDSKNDNKDTATTGQPLGPPPRPSQNGNERGDYFGNVSGNTYQAEPNPFEVQFANPSDTPGKLPSVAALTSPSSLLPADTPGWNSSLRSGPLSPAMLAGPTGTDYFDQGLRSFPTPNESGLRTGLTPGGGGSMFPAASPGTAAMFSLSNMNTPGTMDFLRTGISTRATANGNGPTSQPSDTQASSSIDLRLPNATANQFDTSGNDADAASSLFLLAQNGTRGNTFTGTSQASNGAHSTSIANAAPSRSQDRKGSIGSMSTDENEGSDSDQSEEAVAPKTRSRGKKAPAEKPANRRKATDTPLKTPSNKRSRNSAAADKMSSSPVEELGSKESKKGMTEEDKRKNFLERNRVAALKCRQRKKQWLSNLQQKVDIYGQENEALTNHVNQLREQIYQLKNLLIAHRDCPNLANDPRLLNAMQDPMAGVPGFVPTNGPGVQQIPMMHVANGGPVMPRN